MIKDIDKGLLEAALAVQGYVINEGANDHEAQHQEILKKLHKAHPELGLNKAEHVGKHVSSGGSETHTYEVSHKPSGSKAHDDILPGLKTKVTITHVKHSGDVVGNVRHEWNNGNNAHNVSDFDHKNGKVRVSQYQDGKYVTKEH